eukprot:2366483-Pleurochrysis_carterae.AAC.1
MGEIGPKLLAAPQVLHGLVKAPHVDRAHARDDVVADICVRRGRREQQRGAAVRTTRGAVVGRR